MTALPPIAHDEFRLLKVIATDPVVRCTVQVFKFDLVKQGLSTRPLGLRRSGNQRHGLATAEKSAESLHMRLSQVLELWSKVSKLPSELQEIHTEIQGQLHATLTMLDEGRKHPTKSRSLKSGIIYYALSYVWGNENDKSPILVNNVDFPVTQNLKSALEQLYRRAEYRDKWHWIDQICIEQENQAEKSIQVRHMHEVYSYAKGTLAWLGPGDEELFLGMDSLPQITRTIEASPWPQSMREWFGILKQLPSKGDPIWRAIFRLFGTPWFNRVWTMQEVILSRETRVLCGERTLDWRTIAVFGSAHSDSHSLRHLRDIPKDLQCRDLTMKALSTIIHLNEYCEGNRSPTLTNLLALSSMREASRPIDHIYGIAAMLPDEERSAITTDYSLSYVDAFVAAYRNLIEANDVQVFHLLSMASPLHRRSTSLPSWCLELTSPFKARPHLFPCPSFQAGVIQDQHHMLIQVLGNPRNALSVVGFRVDVVERVVSRSPSDSDWRSVLDFEMECFKLFQTSHSAWDDEEDSKEQYARTLIADHWNLLRSVPPEYKLYDVLEDFRKFWQGAIENPSVTTEVSTSLDEISELSYRLGESSEATFFSTNNGHFGLGPQGLELGDVVCIFLGGTCLYVLRSNDVPGNGAWKLVGNAYIGRFMDLEVTMRDHAAEVGVDEEFIIV